METGMNMDMGYRDMGGMDTTEVVQKDGFFGDKTEVVQ